MSQSCEQDLNKLSIFDECMGNYSKSNSPPKHEWEWNVVSKQCEIYSCGMIGRSGYDLKHDHDPSEIDLCRCLAEKAAATMAGQYMTNDEGTHEFYPFYITANKDYEVVEITEEVIRSAFCNTIYPRSKIEVEPLQERGKWWSTITGCLLVDDNTDDILLPWQDMIKWFNAQPELYSPVFVRIGFENLRDDQEGSSSGCVFPRLAVGITKASSIVGMVTFVTHT